MFKVKGAEVTARARMAVAEVVSVAQLLEAKL